MSRLMLCGVVSCAVLVSPVPARADDTEEKVVIFVELLGGSALRDDMKPGKPVY